MIIELFEGIQTDGVLSGRIQVLRIMIRDDGKLVIEFKTQAKFRGLFVVKHRTYSEQVKEKFGFLFINYLLCRNQKWFRLKE